MGKEDLRIVYMGTPEFAVESLRSLVENGYCIVAVVTMPDKPIGRGYKMQGSPVKEYALSKGIPVLQPERLKDEAFVEALRAYKADLQIVVAFRMLPEIVWGMPRLGTFNLHASLLPQYRGAAPINWAVINGETETGVTTFFLQHDIDTGNIILQEKLPIETSENAGDVHDKLMLLGAKKVLETVDLILKGMPPTNPQEGSENLKPAPKLFKETCRIDWKADGVSIFNFIRGLSPHPGAWFEMELADGTISVVKVFESEYEPVLHGYSMGQILSDAKTFKIAVKDGFLSIRTLQFPGKKRMKTEDFLNGYQGIERCLLKI